MNRIANSRIRIALVVAALALAVPSISHADEGWAKSMPCGVNYQCAMGTNTTASKWVYHYYNGTLHASWPTGGNRSSSKTVYGATTASAATGGSFLSHSANCYCPTGRVCGN